MTLFANRFSQRTLPRLTTIVTIVVFAQSLLFLFVFDWFDPYVYLFIALLACLPILVAVYGRLEKTNVCEDWAWGLAAGAGAASLLMFCIGLAADIRSHPGTFGSSAVIGGIVGLFYAIMAIVLTLPMHVGACFIVRKINQLNRPNTTIFE
jgi:hypothetical protein